MCDFCKTQMDDEFHFVCMCPLYNSFMIKYISSDMRKRNTFTRLRFCDLEETCWKLVVVTFHAGELRQQHLSGELNVTPSWGRVILWHCINAFSVSNITCWVAYRYNLIGQ